MPIKNKEENREYQKQWARKEKNVQYRREQRRKLRKEIIEHYGGCCDCCGETALEFLAIDHINGGGNIHRKSLNIRGGSAFFLWLAKNNYPEGFRVLCHNCNNSLGHYGYCPHTKGSVAQTHQIF